MRDIRACRILKRTEPSARQVPPKRWRSSQVQSVHNVEEEEEEEEEEEWVLMMEGWETSELT